MKQWLIEKWSVMSSLWHLGTAVVQIASTADIPANYRQRSSGEKFVQQILDQFFEDGRRVPQEEQVVFTGRVNAPLKTIVMERGRRYVVWGEHVGHHARHPGLSPFLCPGVPVTTREFTTELVRHGKAIKIVRAYPGDYHPPLPWMESARHALVPAAFDGTALTYSTMFWKEHAYVTNREQTNIRPGSVSQRPPYWYLSKVGSRREYDTTRA
ncbi:hypothetical protein B7Z17_01965 [Candidatus Saccharibacteria bacterium 32-49-10]|nr:MAG: hypothetical protein B7Z17_01965 [Candidatus Saccharibacteria bacterium 32-49-10]